MSKSASYYPEIDGLRAISVLAVILFHAELALPGGYVGVDVFFVISGYLITGIIYKKQLAGQFSLKDFWVRRTKRIVPAAVAMIFVTSIACFFLFTPQEFSNFAKSSIASTALVANVYFWRNTGYFQQEADTMPLLHNWSLAVEEQFYLFFPLFFILLLTYFRKYIVGILIVCVLMSLGLSIATLKSYPEATFFLLPTRAWELGIGALGAITVSKLKFGKKSAECLSTLGLAGIIASMLFYTRSTPFPGLMALPPVVATIMFIVANYRHKTLAGKILSMKPLVIIGLMSYSLYLWHWPILVLGNHYLLTSHSLVSTTIMLSLVFLFGYLSWQFIEKPFRSRKILKSAKSTFIAWGASSAALIGLASCILYSKGFPDRIPRSEAQFVENMNGNGNLFSSPRKMDAPPKPIGSQSKQVDFFLWGDSHAQMLSEAVHEAAKHHKVSGYALISPATPPLPGIFQPNFIGKNTDPLLSLNEERFNIIINSDADHLILAARWNWFIKGFLPTEHKEAEIKGQHFSQITSTPQAPSSIQEAKKAMSSSLRSIAKALREKDKTLWIIKQVPHSSSLYTARNFYNFHRFPNLNQSFDKNGISEEEYDRYNKEFNEVLDSLSEDNVKIVNVKDVFFENSKTLILGDVLPYFRDDDHLSRHGAQKFMLPLMMQIMRQIKNESSSSQ